MAEKVKAKKGTPPPKQMRCNEEFKRNAVDMHLRSGKTQEVVESELRVNVATLQYWCRQFGSVEGRFGKVAARGLEAELQAYKKGVERLRRDNDIPKNRRLFCSEQHLKFDVIQAEKASCPVIVLCEALDVSASAFYEWCNSQGKPGNNEKDAEVKATVREVFENSCQTYGKRRITQSLSKQSQIISLERV